MKRTGLTLFFLILLLGSFGGLGQSQTLKAGMCPVMPGTRVSKKFYVDYQGTRIYLCCRSCVRAFKKHPEKYLPHAAL